MVPFLLLLALSPLLLLSRGAESFSSPLATSVGAGARSASMGRRRRAAGRVCMSSAEVAMPLAEVEDEDDDDEMEWVEEEFELLTERDFYNTEWKIGTLMENKPRDPSSIDTTWVRLVTTDTGENKAIWGDESKGKWAFDVPSQFFSISKESFGGWFGKQIWAGTVEDFYFLEGTVRGWSPISPASVVGQWQAVRLGEVDGERVSPEERGEAPWFMAKEETEEDKEDGEDEEGSTDAAEDEGDAQS